MKPTPFLPLSTWVAVLLGFSGLMPLHAQEDNLKRALEDQKRRTEGLTALANQIKDLVYKYVPGAGGGDQEEKDATTSATDTKVAVREVKLAEVEPATPGAIPAVPLKADGEAAYRQSLQTAATKLNITGTFPKTKQIMIGAKNLGIGDKIAIQYKERFFRLEILDISATELKLKDRESQLELDVAIGATRALPPGMYRSPPPGMMPHMAPPNTEPGGRPSAVSQNREPTETSTDSR